MSLHIENNNCGRILSFFKVRSLFVGLILLALVLSCADKGCKEQFLHGKYEGYWAETMWTYEFKRNGEFIFTTRGHYGNVVDSGFYLMKDSLILLNPRSDWHVIAGVLYRKLKIINSECLRDFQSNYYCSPIDTINRWNDKEIEFQEKVKAALDTAEDVRLQKEMISSKYTDPHIEVAYVGIMMVDNKEFHEFNLANYNIKNGVEVYLTFYATKEPFDIFQLDSKSGKMKSLSNESNIK